MDLKHFLLSTSLLCGLALLPVAAHADPLSDDLSARAEVGVKGGSERSILTTEFWAPLAQSSGKVFYTDLRLMGDDDDNREGNLGLGYRQISETTNSVLGSHVWIDRRRTQHNSTFHQVTFGVESLGKVIDLRANGYVPLNGANTVSTPNTGSVTPYLAGSGIFYDTAGSVSETPQYGADAEIGYRLPILQNYTDTIRIYGGGYSFFRENTDSVTGYRVRTEAVINPVLSVGARFQHDNPRGSQGFLEATLRFPFSAKKMYQQKGLYGRLDESPERDVDIVTSSKVDNGLFKPFLNSAGTDQRVLYVDNTSSANGDGTKEHPFNTLAQAQIALKANDILYIARGNGTTTGMDQGITIAQNDVSVIGSGSAFTFGGYTFLNAGIAPTITNNTAYVDDGVTNTFTGNGIFVTGANASISGVTVNGAQGNGIYGLIIDGSHWNSFNVTNSTVTNSVNAGGIHVKEYGGTISNTNFYGGSIDNVNITNNTVNTNKTNNIFINMTGTVNASSTMGNVLVNGNQANDGSGGLTVSVFGGKIDNLGVNDNTITAARGDGIQIQTNDSNSIINTVSLNRNTVLNSTGQGIQIFASKGAINSVDVRNIIASNNKGSNGGLGIVAGSMGRIEQINVQDITATGNTKNGWYVWALGAGSYIGQVTASNITTSNNSSSGVFIADIGGGTINSVDISNVTAANNTDSGIFVSSSDNGLGGGGGSIGTVRVDNASTFNNGLHGVAISGSNASAGAPSAIGSIALSNIVSSGNTQQGVYVLGGNFNTINQVTGNNITVTNNRQNGLYIVASSGGTTLSNAVFTNIIANNNTLNGMFVESTFNGKITNFSVSGLTATSNGSAGFAASSQNSSTAANISSINLSSSTMTGNSNGINIGVNNTGTMGTVTITGVTITGSRGSGIITSVSGVNSSINTVNILNNTISAGASNGIYILSQGSGTSLANTNISGNNVTGNTGIGLNFNLVSGAATFGNVTVNNNNFSSNANAGISVTATTGSVNNMVISNNTINNNTGANGYGITLQALSANNLSASLIHNTVTGNALNGLYVNKGTTGTFVVDAGGGTLGSTGQNRIWNNTGTEVRVDGGYALQALTDYWGGGDLVVGEKTLNGGSTVTTTGFLTVDPGP